MHADWGALQVGLQQFLERCQTRSDGAALDMVADWSTQMSLGEQQRLAFGRVLLANPALVLLDESTSALDAANEARLYTQLRDRGMAFISVGHRESLRQFHDRVLDMSAAAQLP
jgi:vitamin B12/bleomycin/antimicrobial peptide transport system ATP-binding/permease protein